LLRSIAVTLLTTLLVPGCALYDGLAGGGCDGEPFYQPVNLTIPDNNPTGVSSSVFATGGPVDGVTIYVDTEHRFPGELNYQLSHSGYSVFFEEDGSHDFTDFDGVLADGEWRLTIWDDVGADEGYWYYWEIAVCTSGG
jgi:subtilisin-like proprotein convertase family protein